MCGIAGALIPGPREEAVALVERMLGALGHRGPDDRGVVAVPVGDGWLCLGSTRLAIIDRSPAGHMPMESGGAHLVYNGETYNFRALRAELEWSGTVFRSRTDTEVVLQSFRRWGEDFVARLRGMFALALWDGRDELLLARDRAGKKPLYYSRRGASLLFASEVRALLESAAVRRRLDPVGVETFLANGFVAGPRTLVEGVRALPPGTVLRVRPADGAVEERRYWWPVSPRTEPQDHAALAERLRESVSARLVADVPLGVFLSGGLDSAAIAALAVREGAAVHTVSVAFDEPGFDESAAARRTASLLGTAHREVRVTRDTFAGWLPDGLAAMDQPTFDGLNTYMVSRAARESGLVVAVSGLGADELFGGYPFFRHAVRLARVTGVAARVPAARRAAARRQRLSGAWKLADLDAALLRADPALRPVAAYQATQALFPSWARRRLHPDGPPASDVSAGLPAELARALADEVRGDDHATAISKIAWRVFLGERCLRDTDSMSMAVSLEVRAPFTDHLFVEAAMSVPGRERLAGAPGKPLLRRVLEGIVPPGCAGGSKKGFVIPMEAWLRGSPVRPGAEETLRDIALVKQAGLDPPAAEGILRGFERGAVPWSRVWALHVLLDWCRRNEVAA